MTDIENKTPELANDKAENQMENAPESHIGLEDTTVADVVTALESGNAEAVRELIEPLHYSDAADLVEQLNVEQRRQLIEYAHDVLDPEFLVEVDETVRDEIIEHIGIDSVAETVAELDTDDAVNLIGELEEEDKQQVLDTISESDRAIIEKSLSYPEYSAGRLMQREVMTVPQFWTVGETIDFMRQMAEQDEWAVPDLYYEIVVVDPKHCPVGRIPLSVLLSSRRPINVSDIMSSDIKLITATMDQEEVAHLFRQRDLVSASVVDDEGRLVGMITIDDVVDVIDDEAEEDIMRMGGVREDDFYSATIDTTRARFSWLFINLGTAIAASLVIGMFQASIEQIVALAVLMPIVASMGGNAGTQTLTVVVRALATKEITPANAMRQVGKESMVGVINGILFAVLMGLVAWVWFDTPMLGVVIAMAMVVNMVVAGLAGASIPMVLEKVGVDPAIASSVFLTTVTDVIGFLVFLGLGTLLLI
ncbi:MAG: magnesium transporter [Rhodospirillaceae bacterium]|nr:magnesium transporter [Rhodospirillaceae bacterium]